MRMPTISGDDHYHWLTALVSSHQFEKPACRLIALTAFLLGIIPLLLIRAEPGHHPTGAVVVACGIALCATAIALLWAIRCWPTREQSCASAIVATVCVAAAVAVIPDPLVAVLGAMAFAGPAGFSALFLTRRLLLATWAVAAVSLAAAAWRLGAADPLLAAAVVPMVVLVNLFAGCAWLLSMYLNDSKVSSMLIDPLTGLLNRTAFDEQISTVLGARERSHDRHLVIAVISVDTYGLLMSMGDSAKADRACITAARQLRGTVRRDAVLAHRGDGDFLVADLFVAEDPSGMLERLRGTLTDRPAKLSASIGAISTPLTPLIGHPVNDVIDELLHLADQARLGARGAGGNAARCTINPPLAVLGDSLPPH